MKWILKIIMYIGIGVFILGLFDLQPTKFGRASITSLFGLMIMVSAYFENKLRRLKDEK